MRRDVEPHELEPGEYGKDPVSGIFYAVPPDTDLIANLSGHAVVEHDDGTITVSPSIKVSARDRLWHGYLERGVWRQV